MASRSRRYSPSKITAWKVRRLQKAGYLKNVDPTAKPTPAVFAQFSKHKDLLTGRAAVVKAPTQAKAATIRQKLGLGGKGASIVVPKEKGERFRVTKTGEIHSTRHIYGQTVHKTIGKRPEKPKLGKDGKPGRAYYTLPRRKRGLGYLKRTTFSSFDEMLFYLNKYEIDFEDIEDFIEVEEFRPGGKRDKEMAEKIAGERRRAVKRLKRKRSKASRRGSRRGR